MHHRVHECRATAAFRCCITRTHAHTRTRAQPRAPLLLPGIATHSITDNCWAGRCSRRSSIAQAANGGSPGNHHILRLLLLLPLLLLNNILCACCSRRAAELLRLMLPLLQLSCHCRCKQHKGINAHVLVSTTTECCASHCCCHCQLPCLLHTVAGYKYTHQC